jgi:hypothetical protein
MCQTTSRSRERVPFLGTAIEPTINHHCLMEVESGQVAGAKGPMEVNQLHHSLLLLVLVLLHVLLSSLDLILVSAASMYRLQQP